ncbi:MAG: acetate kinase [Candidatus Eremiobacteraeota bacterium]|nr:acetate kinase [Candidatus Eremiobacteraeota bacterium]
MNVLVLNVGSSSLKFQLMRTDAERLAANTDEILAGGVVERLGGEAVLTLRPRNGPTVKTTAPLRDQRAAVEYIVGWLVGPESGAALGGRAEINAVGHRVVHGGERFTRSVRISDEVEREIAEMIDLAPLHNPANLRGIQAARAVLGIGTPQVAVFDTAFHQTLPPHAYLYAIPYQLYRRYKIRRYGFHGTSHRYVAHRWRQLTGAAREETHLITLHLGNGCSACAIRAGDSVDTSMGFTPLEGLVMGTRSGDVDPAILDYLASKEGLSLAEGEALLNKQSGLLGISGLTNDMRELLAEARENDDRRARLAVEVFCYRVRKYIGAYLAALGGAVGFVFTGGIGENSAEVRARVCEGLGWAGIDVDADRNTALTGGQEGVFTTERSRLPGWVIPTDEELLIARDTFRVLADVPARF